MKRTATVLMSVSLVLVVVWSLAWAQGPTNLLVSPGFEGPYRSYNSINELIVDAAWTPWYLDGGKYIPGIDSTAFEQYPTGRPEYKQALASQFPTRVRSGASAQQGFNFSRTGYWGLYQMVYNVEQGQILQGSVWAQGWCSNTEDKICAPYTAYVSVGIDPEGGTWWGSRSVQWSQWQQLTNQYVQFVSPKVLATGNKVSFWISVSFVWALKHNDAYFDDAVLSLVAGGEPTQPTATPYPTYTPRPTGTPYPTYTPYPTQQPCPTVGPGTPSPVDCPSIEEIRQVVAEELGKLILGVIGGK